MRNLINFIAFFVVFTSYCQQDQLKINFDISLGSVNYHYDVIENPGYSFSSAQWNDTVHSLAYGHKYYTYHGLNALLHFGLQIPIFNNKVFSFGLRPKVGLGKLFQISPNPKNSYDYNGWDVIDNKRISSITLDAELSMYLRYNLYTNHLIFSHISLYGGARYLFSHDDYLTPIIGAEYGKVSFSVGVYTHLFRMNYYREFSDGSTEVAKSFHEFGIRGNFFINKPKKKKTEKEEPKSI